LKKEKKEDENINLIVNGRESSFWHHQYVNCQIALNELNENI